MKNPQNNRSVYNELETAFRNTFINGGTVVNEKYASLAGSKLQQGDASVMNIYRSTKQALEKMKH